MELRFCTFVPMRVKYFFSSCRRICHVSLRLSELLNVSVLFPQDGHLVPEQHGVEPHLGANQGHVAQPAAKDVHAGLPLGEMVWVSPS